MSGYDGRFVSPHARLLNSMVRFTQRHSLHQWSAIVDTTSSFPSLLHCSTPLTRTLRRAIQPSSQFRAGHGAGSNKRFKTWYPWGFSKGHCKSFTELAVLGRKGPKPSATSVISTRAWRRSTSPSQIASINVVRTCNLLRAIVQLQMLGYSN